MWLVSLAPVLLRFLGEGALQRYFSHRQAMAATASEAERTRLDADVRLAAFELRRREAMRDLQLRELQLPFLWWPKFILMLLVCLYWAARFLVRTVGLDDFGVAIAELSPAETAVSGMVLAYLFLGDKIERMGRRG